MATQYVKRIAEYFVKDEEARQNIQTLQAGMENVNTSLQTQRETINSQSTLINSHTNSIASLTQDVQTLKNAEHISMQYDASTETITFT